MQLKNGFTIKADTPHGMIIANKIDGEHEGVKVSLEAPWLDEPITLAVIEYDKHKEGISLHFREDSASKKGSTASFQNYLSCVKVGEVVYVSLMGNGHLLGTVVAVQENGNFTIEDLKGERTEVSRLDISKIRKLECVEDWMRTDLELIISLGGNAASTLCGRIKKIPEESEETFKFRTSAEKDLSCRKKDVKAAYTWIRKE